MSNSKLGSSMTTLAPGSSLASNTVSSSDEMEERLTRDMRYWNPWQPPDSTVMRRARKGLESLAMISLRRYCKEKTKGLFSWGWNLAIDKNRFSLWWRTDAARGVMSIIISFPSSSFRGFAVTITALLGEAVENCRWWGRAEYEVGDKRWEGEYTEDEERLLRKDGKGKSGAEWRSWMWGLYVGRTRQRRIAVLESDWRSFVADRRSCNACKWVVAAVAILSIDR